MKNKEVSIKPIKGGLLSLLKIPFFSDLTPLALSLRREVFVEEQHVPLDEEFDEKEISSIHLVGIFNGNVVTTCRLIFHDDYAQISRFVVRKSLRRLGIGRAMLEYSIALAADYGYKNLYLEAQSSKLELYRKFGLKEFDEEFLDGGIPHRKMRNY